MKCFYHNDHDGLFAAGCIAVDFPGGNGDDAKYLAVDYKDSFPLACVERDELVWIVDFSIEPDLMRRLLEITPHVVWIDHHQTAIDKYAGFEHPLHGVRDASQAACVLTYKYITWLLGLPRNAELRRRETSRHQVEFLPTPDEIYEEPPEVLDNLVPLSLRYVADRDTWTWRLGPATQWFHDGLNLHNELRPKGELMKRLLHVFDGSTESQIEMINEILLPGRIIEQYRTQWFERYRAAWAYDTTFEGHRALAMNLQMCGSDGFGHAFHEYPLVIAFAHDGLQYQVSLYSHELQGIDVSKLAEKYGGGGHKGAAGFPCKELPWRRPSMPGE